MHEQVFISRNHGARINFYNDTDVFFCMFPMLLQLLQDISFPTGALDPTADNISTIGANTVTRPEKSRAPPPVTPSPNKEGQGLLKSPCDGDDHENCGNRKVRIYALLQFD